MKKQLNCRADFLVMGITGSFGSGKSTVAQMFQELGAKIIDADKINHHVLKEPRIKKKIRKIFGEGVFKDKEVNRRKLARVVFQDRWRLNKLCLISHSVVCAEIKLKLSRLKCRAQIIIIDAPLLIEAGLDKIADVVVVVSALRDVQINRLQQKGYSKSQILSRIRMQLPMYVKRKRADYVINNSHEREKTQKQVLKIWSELWNMLKK
ncbi:MAG: dephospho-CoA kinase [Candidatus Omnitrophota bacterium]